MMIGPRAKPAVCFRLPARWCAALLAGVLLAGGTSYAQPQPSPAALAAANELIELKGAAHMFDPVVPGVIETAKNTLLQTNTTLSKELNEVAAALRQQYAGKRAEVTAEIARLYAQRFTEAEIKQAIAFYKTPLGKKLIEEEPRVLEESMGRIQNWADRFAEDMLRRFREEMRKKGHNL
jgi:hypothetical protein